MVDTSAPAMAAAISAPHARLPVTLDSMLRYFVDLRRPAPRRLLRLLASRAATATEHDRLEKLGELARGAAGVHGVSTGEVLSRCSASLLARVTPAELLAHSAAMAARFYSIASASSVHPTEAWVACGRSTHFDAAHTASFVGCASRYLSRLRPGDASLVFPVPSDFRLIDLVADDQPLVMIANGSGMAPFRAFIEERRARGSTAPTVLIYGCMYPDHDYLYGDDMAQWQAEGVCDVHAIFSHYRAE